MDADQHLLTQKSRKPKQHFYQSQGSYSSVNSAEKRGRFSINNFQLLTYLHLASLSNVSLTWGRVILKSISVCF